MIADPEALEWRARVRRARRLRRRARVAAAGSAAGAGVAAVALPGVSPGLLVPSALAAGLAAAAVTGARAARRLVPGSPPPAPLPAPGSTGYGYCVRLAAAENAVQQLLAQCREANALDAAEMSRVRTAASSAARDLRQVARRLAAAESALRATPDASARRALDGTVSSLAADLSDGVRDLERLVATAGDLLGALAPQAIQWRPAVALEDARNDLRTRAEGLREIQGRP